jgi:branched-subunit amino acid transport protein
MSASRARIRTLNQRIAGSIPIIARHSVIGIAACAVAGVSWIAVFASLNVSAQMSLPDWVRGRGLAMFVTVFFGAMTTGSALWGQFASALGLPTAHFIAAAGAVAGIAATWHWKRLSGAGVDLAPSMHWPAPVLAIDADGDRGPVLVTVEYRVAAEKRDAFLGAVRKLGQQRRRDGHTLGTSSWMRPSTDASSRPS